MYIHVHPPITMIISCRNVKLLNCQRWRLWTLGHKTVTIGEHKVSPQSENFSASPTASRLHSPGFKTSMQTNCELTDCTGKSWNCFFALEAFKFLRQLLAKFAILHSSSLPPSGIQNERVNKADQFCTAQQQVDNNASKSDHVCDYIPV